MNSQAAFSASPTLAYSCTSSPIDLQSLPPNLVVSSCGAMNLTSHETAKFGRQYSIKDQTQARWQALNRSAFQSIVEGETELAAAKWLDALALIEFEPYTDERLTRNLDCLVETFLLLDMYKEAIRFCLDSLEIKRAAYDQWDSRVADCLIVLADIYYRDRQFDKVENCCLEAEQIYVETQGSKSADIASVAANLALFYHSQNRHFQSLKRYMQAIEIKKTLVPKDHPSLIALYTQYANLLRAIGCN